MFSDMSNSIPGVDEAMSFAELMKMVQNMNFSCIVFDTAPTGHTLRLLSFPTIMDKALSKLMDLKNKFSGLLSQFGNMFGGGGVRMSRNWSKRGKGRERGVGHLYSVLHYILCNRSKMTKKNQAIDFRG